MLSLGALSLTFFGTDTASLWAEKAPQIGQNHTFCLITFHPSITSNEILPKCEVNWCEHKIAIADTGKTSVRFPWGLLGLKTPLLGAFYDECQKWHFVCRYSGFLWCWIQIYSSQYLKLHGSPIFGLWFTSPGTFMTKNAPKMPILFKKTFFGA